MSDIELEEKESKEYKRSGDRRKGGGGGGGGGRSGFRRSSSSSEGSRPYFKGGRGIRKKRKGCRFCDWKVEIDYKDVDRLAIFVTDQGKILNRRATGACAKHQRALTRAVKRSRRIALLPYVGRVPDNPPLVPGFEKPPPRSRSREKTRSD